ncbi:MAG: TIGR02757 family protein [Kiritimatiellia bacterium]
MAKVTKAELERIYRKYNRRKYVIPDPLQFLYAYSEVRDREIAALIASSLAYGRVTQIVNSVQKALAVAGPSPRKFIEETAPREIDRRLAHFTHRFTTGVHLAGMLKRVRKVLRRYGSLNRCFLEGLDTSEETVLPALAEFVRRLDCRDNYLLPDPRRGSACKRLNLFLRWMVRKDTVDPGGWRGVPAAMLIVPLDTHMAAKGRELEITDRKAPDIKMALEMTAFFRSLCPGDPVKYDFALTRPGIRRESE